LKTKDGAIIYYEDHGSGQPILLVHGWNCSTKFWQRNVPELSKQFRVVTLDLRGHGNSSKILTGHTISQYASDVRALIEHLGLDDVTLAGWSLGGPVVLSYYEQFRDDSRLKALGLVDANPFPFNPADWNDHTLKNYNYEGMNATFREYMDDPRKFEAGRAAKMFKDGKVTDSDLEWVSAELNKTPVWIGVAAYSDYLMTDYAHVLPTLRIPVIVFASSSEGHKTGIEVGKSIAAQIPNSTFVRFEGAGHILFYEQPEKFNQALIDFIRKNT
jgi:pimeloyl-ACP methyl ester carboxylesterase